MKQEDTKVKIIEKALELFSGKGYDAVSVAEIAKAVGIKAPSLYNHYPSKQAIFDAIFDATIRQYDDFTQGIHIHINRAEKDTAIFSEITEDELVRKVTEIFEYSLHCESVSRFRKMMTIEQFRSPKLSALYSERYVERLVDYHAEIFKGLIKSGIIKNENPHTLAMMYFSPVITLLGICDRQPEKEEECIKRIDGHVRLFFRTFQNKKD